MVSRGSSLWLVLLVTGCGGVVGAQEDSGGEGGGGVEAGALDGVDGSRGRNEGGPGADAGGPTMPDSGTDGGSADEGGDAEEGTEGGSCPASQPMGGTWVDEGPCDTNGLVCRYTSTNFLCECLRNDCAGGGCCPVSCEQLGFPCGVVGDGCGGELHCRVCPAGQSCSANGPNATCVPSDDAGAAQEAGVCVPPGCPQPACGVIDDGCGGKIDCGECIWNCQPGMM